MFIYLHINNKEEEEEKQQLNRYHTCLDCVKNFQNADLIENDDYKAVQL